MKLLDVLSAETLKMKRTLAVKMAFLAPAIVVVLGFLAAWQAPHSTAHRSGAANEWAELTRFVMRLWAFLMLPLYITLEAALLAALDHAGGQWRSILARPAPRWTFYAAKLIVVLALAAAASVLLALGIALDGVILPHAQPVLTFARPVPWGLIFGNAAQAFGLAFLGLAVQNWVSLRWQSFSAAVGTGVVALVAGVFAAAVGQATESWLRYFPSALPILVLGRDPHHIEIGLWISLAGGAAVALAACADFCRREVS